VTLSFRVVALYNFSNKIAVPLTIYSIVAAVVASTIAAVLRTHVRSTSLYLTLPLSAPSYLFPPTATAEPTPGVYCCTMTYCPSWAAHLIIPSGTLDTALFFLAFGACLKDMKQIRDMRGWNTESLLSVVMRDSLFYYVA
jgi:hypothetical protein